MNRTAWIACTVLWVLAAIPAVVAAALSAMLFDSPGSESSPLTIALFWAMVASPVFCLLGAGVPWIFRKRAFGKWLFLIPFVDAVAVAVVFWLIDTRCGGMLSCK